jgi:hypothetical protein
MSDVEEMLTRELHEVADHVRVPALPVLPREPARRPWRPLAAAAAALVVVAGGVAVATRGDSPEPSPAPAPQTPSTTPSPSAPSPSDSPSSPSPSKAESAAVPRGTPSVPYVVNRTLYVDRERVPGEWWSVQAGEAAWLALRSDNTWWWGWDAEPHEIAGPHDTPPVISPNGKYIAYLTRNGQDGLLTGFDTRPDGEGLGSVLVDLGDRQDGSLVTVRAVTDDGEVIAQGSRTAVLWRPLVPGGGEPVDLTASAPDLQVLASTPAGIVVTRGADSREGEPFLADLSEDGELSAKASVPAYDSLAVSRAGTWLTWLPPGTLGGEVATVTKLDVQRVDGSGQATLSAPDGWGFRVEQWAWEDDDYLVAPVAREGGAADSGAGDRMARCSPAAGRCVLLPPR